MISTNVRTFFEKGTKRSTPELQMIEQDENSILYKNILSLPIKYREVLILYYYKELSVDEISKLMDLNVSSVKTRLRRSREKLKQLLPNEKGSEFIGS
jgi:RNA polymerase sigma-70 factor (ECF subfamily)